MTLSLNNIFDNPGARHSKKRVGRGMASGRGKTSSKGQKGQKSRSGVAIKGFEGGQMPLYRRLPKRGFTRIRDRSLGIINVRDIAIAVEKGILTKDGISLESLKNAGIVKSYITSLRLLGNGTLAMPVTIEVDYVTESARSTVEKAGGAVKVRA